MRQAVFAEQEVSRERVLKNPHMGSMEPVTEN